MFFLFLYLGNALVNSEPLQFRTVMFYDLQQDCDPIETKDLVLVLKRLF